MKQENLTPGRRMGRAGIVAIMVSGHFFSAPPSGRSSRSFFCWDRSQVYGELAHGYGALAWHGHEMLSTGATLRHRPSLWRSMAP